MNTPFHLKQTGSSPARLHSIVLAAGDGRRMATLTRALFGRWIPKQFAAIGGQRTLLQQTVDRSLALVPAEQTLVVVGSAFEELATRQLAEFPGLEIVVQPDNKGTGPGVLLPLSRLLCRDPDAEVVIYPADQRVARPEALIEAVDRARLAARQSPAGVALVGATPDTGGRDLGWVVPGAPLEGVPGGHRVAELHEKLSRSLADRLRGGGGLWNTFVLVGSARAIWELCRTYMPAQTAASERYIESVGEQEHGLRALYGKLLTPADFNRSVLERAAGLAVVKMTGAGWSDWGRPETVLESLRGTPGFGSLLDRLLSLAGPVDRRRWLKLFGAPGSGHAL